MVQAADRVVPSRESRWNRGAIRWVISMDMQHCASSDAVCYRDAYRGSLDATSLIPCSDYDAFDRIGTGNWYTNAPGIYAADHGPVAPRPYPCPSFPGPLASSPTTCSPPFVPSSPTVSTPTSFQQRSPGHSTSSSMFDTFMDNSMSCERRSVREDLSPSSETSSTRAYTSSSNESTPEKLGKNKISSPYFSRFYFPKHFHVQHSLLNCSCINSWLQKWRLNVPALSTPHIFRNASLVLICYIS